MFRQRPARGVPRQNTVNGRTGKLKVRNPAIDASLEASLSRQRLEKYLLGARYDATLWRGALFRAFLARGGMKRSVVHGRFNAIRRFRNRVAHHEPVFHKDVAGMHDEIIEAISWMRRDTSAWAAYHSRVAAAVAAP